MVCLETTFLIDLIRGENAAVILKDELEKHESVLSVTAVSVMELWSGASLAKVPVKEYEKINELLESLEVLDLDLESAKESGVIEADLARRGLPIQSTDVMIAGIAKTHHEKLVTRDEHFVRIPGLRVLKY